MKYLGAVSLDGYNILSNKPIASVEDMNGLKIGAVGLNQTWIANTGAAPVAITGVSVYNDLQTGVIDGVILTPSLIRSNKSYEVADTLTMVNFGAIYQLSLAANLGVWDGYPEPVREAIQSAAKEWQSETVSRLTKAYEDSLAFFPDNGVTVTKLSDEARAAWAAKLPNVPLEWISDDPVRRKVVEAYIGALEAAGETMARDWLGEN